MTLRTLLCAVLVLSLTGCVAYGGGGHYSPGWGYYDHDRWDHDYRRDEGRSVIIYQPSHDRRYYSRDRYVPRPDSYGGHRNDRRHEQSWDNGRDRGRYMDRDRRPQNNGHSVVPRQPRQGQAEGYRQDPRQSQFSRQEQRQQRDNWQSRRQQDPGRQGYSR